MPWEELILPCFTEEEKRVVKESLEKGKNHKELKDME